MAVAIGLKPRAKLLRASVPMWSGAVSGGLVAACTLAAVSLLGPSGPEVARFHAGQSEVHEHFAPFEAEAPPPPSAAPAPLEARAEPAPAPGPGRSAAEPEASSLHLLGGSAGALALGASVLAGGKRVHRRRVGKQTPAYRDAEVQTSPFDLSTLTPPTSSATDASDSTPSRLRRHGRRA